MTTVIVTGAAGPLGRAVCARLSADPDVTKVVAIDCRPFDLLLPKVEPREADLLIDEVKPLIDDADVVIHLATAFGPAVESEEAGEADVEATRRLLDAAADAAVRTLVVLSSAVVYGAWANNPVPLTEDAPLRPNPGFVFAVHRGEVERLVAEWGTDHPDASVAVLRPTVVVADGRPSWLARVLRASASIRAGADEPPGQFVHVDDVAGAVVLAQRERLDGAFNVAPDGWIRGEQVRALAGGVPRLRLPERVTTRLAGLRWRLGLAPTPPGAIPLTIHPWVIANDRLRAAGWEPEHTNEEAYVAGHAPRPWERISPRRRQELALAASAVGLVGLAAGAVVLVRRLRRRSRDA